MKLHPIQNQYWRGKGTNTFHFIFEGAARQFAQFLTEWGIVYDWTIRLDAGMSDITIMGVGKRYLLVRYGGTYQQTIPAITQEVLEKVSKFGDGEKLIRFHNGQFEYLSPHKWRTRREGGGWDSNGPWKEKWEPLHHASKEQATRLVQVRPPLSVG